MDEYIKREAAIRALTLHDCDSARAKMAICDLPAADVASIRHGKWVDRYGGKYDNQLYECSECKRIAPYKFENDSLGIGLWVQDLTDYCPNCGARMDGDHDG